MGVKDEIEKMRNEVPLGVVDGKRISWKDPYTHLMVVGKSGSGKSAFLTHCWKEIEVGAKVMIEPSGFLSQDCYSISKGKAQYCSLDHPLSLNPMLLPYPPGTVVDIIVEAINQMIALTAKDSVKVMTPNMLGIVDFAVRYCLEHNRKSLAHVRDFVAAMNAPAEAKNGVVSRLNVVLSEPRLDPVLCGDEAVNCGEMIAGGQSLIVDCSQMSRDKMIFLGTLATLQIEAYFRFERPKEYRPLFLFLDEAANFLSQPVLSVLREARKFHVSAIIALVDLNIPEPILRSVLNVGSLISFRVGAREAAYLSREMNIRPTELQFLPKYHMACLLPPGSSVVDKLLRGEEEPQKSAVIVKAPSPPHFKKYPVREVPTKVELPRLSFTWSSVKSCQPAPPP